MEMPGEIGGYRLLEKLGSGGMGEVFLARDGQGRMVAVKTVRVALGDRPELRARLRREAATMARVQSPHVAELIHADVDRSVPYLVTRYVEGRSLSDVVRERGPLQGAELWAIADGLAEAVDQIHQAGCLHRDIKPDNVIVTDGRPIVIDFGISHALDETRFTRNGSASGTSRYMAPELLLDGTVGPPADVFAWGATVAFAAIGQNPHWPHLRPDDIDDLLRDILGVALRGPVIAALSRDPARRPPSAGLRAFIVRHRHIGRLLDEAERRVRSVPHLPGRQVTAFVEIAEAHMGHDPAKASELLAEAVGLTPSPVHFFPPLEDVARALASRDPGTARQFVLDRATGRTRGSAYLEIAKVLRTTEPSEARTFLGEAEPLYLAYGFADCLVEARVLAEFSAAWRGLDDRRAGELSAKAAELVFTELARREQEGPDHPYEDTDAETDYQASGLAKIAAAFGQHEPEAAERLLAEAAAFASEPRTVGDVAVLLARHDPEDARRLARQISTLDYHHASFELPRIARVLAERAPCMAREILTEAELIARTRLKKNAVPEALARIATPLFAHDADAARALVAEAERLAFPRGLYFGAWHTPELVGVLALFDLEHAERIARTLAEPLMQADAFREIAVSLGSSVPLQR